MSVDRSRWEPLDRDEFSPTSRAGRGWCSRGDCDRPAEWMRWAPEYHRSRVRGLAFCSYHAERDLAAITKSPFMDRPDSVYYASKDGLIKIGTSVCVPVRMLSLCAALLATESGGYALEAARHREFAHLRIEPRGEWFRPAPDLLAHVASLSDLSERRAS